MSGERADICVVGGGIVGLSFAFEVARRGVRVCVIERACIGERAAAGVAAGMLAPVSEADISHPELTQLALASAAYYPEWVASLEAMSGRTVGYEATGTLIVAAERDHLALIDHLRAFQRDRGLDAEPLTRSALRELEPALAPSVVGGVRVADGEVDPRRVLGALVAAIERLDGELREQACVQSLAACGDGVHVTYEQDGTTHTVQADAVVLAAGAWSGDVRIAGIELPLRPVKGQVLRLHGKRLLQHVVRTPDVYLVPRANGELVVGATMEERGFDRANRAGAVLDLLTDAARVLPDIRELDLAECNVGFRPTLRDHLPAIGETGERGVYLATGHFRDGVLLAPITARLLADLVLDGRATPLLEAFAPSRFAIEVVS